MRMSLKEMPENIIRYVVDGTKIVNTVLLFCHIYFGFMFYKYDAEVLFYYNFISIITYIFSYVLLKKGRAWEYVIIVYFEIFVFMILAVVYLGWDYGFQQYCIGFVASIIFTDFYMNHGKVMSKTAMAMVAFDVFVYIALRFWSYNNPYVYEINDAVFKRSLFVSNSLIGFSFLILYSSIYSSTVYKLENELLERANIDPLTGLFNRRKMKQVLTDGVKEFKNKNIMAAMIDVDYFKQINDKYGHDAGDEVLKALASLLRELATKNESMQVCRWGGEEFLIFDGDCKKDKEAIYQEFESLRSRAEKSVVICDGEKINFTITIGLAEYQNSMSVEELIKVADNNLYKGKEKGRNKVVW